MSDRLTQIPTGMNTIEKIIYWTDHFSWIKLNKPKEIAWLFRNDIDNVLAITGLPWWWKWGFNEKIWKIHNLNVRDTAEYDPNLLILWQTDLASLLHFVYVNLDCFFKEIWPNRYTIMLENLENFVAMFSDEPRAKDFVKKVINTIESFLYEWVYLKTDKEREQAKSLSSLMVNWRNEWTKLVTMLDWVNSFNIANLLVAEILDIKLNVLKVIIEPNLGLAFQRLIKRDVIWNWKKKTKPLDTVTEFRLREWFFLFESFTLPALYDKDSYMLDYTHKTNYELSKDQRTDAIRSIIKSWAKLYSEKKWEDFDSYLTSYISLLIEHFNHYS